MVRDVLLSSHARGRGYWDAAQVEQLIAAEKSPHWFDVTWKLLCVETWARTFLDGASHAA